MVVVLIPSFINIVCSLRKVRNVILQLISYFLLRLTLLLLYSVIRALFSQYKIVAKYKGPFRMNNKERGSHARGVYLAQDTSRMGTARVKQEEEADTRMIVKE